MGIGSTVVILRDGEKNSHKFEIVGSEEADIAQGRLSIHSPLGEAMLGKKKGETFAFQSPKGKMTYKVIDIE